jgi:hypothetical protein
VGVDDYFGAFTPTEMTIVGSSLVKVEDVHLGEPGAVRLVLEDTSGVARHFRRLAGLVDDVERPASDLIGILAVLLKADDFERVVLSVARLESVFPELSDRLPAMLNLIPYARISRAARM